MRKSRVIFSVPIVNGPSTFGEGGLSEKNHGRASALGLHLEATELDLAVLCSGGEFALEDKEVEKPRTKTLVCSPVSVTRRAGFEKKNVLRLDSGLSECTGKRFEALADPCDGSSFGVFELFRKEAEKTGSFPASLCSGPLAEGSFGEEFFGGEDRAFPERAFLFFQ